MPVLTIPPRDMLLTAVVGDASRAAAYIVEGRQVAREGEVLGYSILWAGFASISAVLTEAFQDGKDISAVGSVLTGTDRSNVNIQTCKIFTVPTGSGGTSIVLECTLTGVDDQGVTQINKVGVTFDILPPGAG